MISYRNRLFIAIFSVVYLFISICISWILSYHIVSKSDIFAISTFAIVTSFNIAILFSWVGFGIIGGSIVTVVTFLFVFLLSFKTKIYTLHFFATTFSITVFIGYLFALRKNKMDQFYILRTEKLNEDINVLLNEILESSKSIKVTEDKIMRYSLLKKVAESLSTVLDIDSIGKILISGMSRIIGKKGRILLFLAEPDKEGLKLFASEVRSSAVIKAKKGDEFDIWVERYRKPLIIEDVTKDFRFPTENINIKEIAFRSLISIPFINNNKVIGIIRMDNPREFFYVQDDLRLLGIIANLGAVAIQNALLYSRTQELAIRDSLTGLKVRRFFMESFYREIKRAARKKEPLSFLVLDIDHFKKYNDKYGHTSGDIVLKSLADLINDSLNEADVGGRFGGEEMAILLWNKNKKEAFAYAEKIRFALKNKHIFLRQEEASVTVSIGISTYPQDALSEDELIKIADMRLYKAKVAGRDRVCCE